MTVVKLHRGARTIGGTITEIISGESHIFIDFGAELSVPCPEESTDPEMIRMITESPCDAVIFTHYHGDHAGLMDRIPKKDVRGKRIRLYIGKTAASVLWNIHVSLLKFEDISPEEKRKHEDYLNLLRDRDRLIHVEDGKDFVPDDDGAFRITPVRVDHSAYDAYLYIIESVKDHKVIVHTGDFRTHGRLGKDLFSRVESAIGQRRADVLITEGTMMSRSGEKVLTEEQLQHKAEEILRKPENKYAFLLCSSTNMESLASFANAAFSVPDGGERRGFYVNSYVMRQIELFRKTAGKNGTDRDFGFWKTYRLERPGWMNPVLGMPQSEYMEKHGFLMLTGLSESYAERIARIRETGHDPLLIYAMWGGYVNQQKYPDTYREDLGGFYNAWPKDRRIDLHTAGHATAEDIAAMIRTVGAAEYILPVHTQDPEAFSGLSIGEEARRILRTDLADGEEIVL